MLFKRFLLLLTPLLFLGTTLVTSISRAENSNGENKIPCENALIQNQAVSDANGEATLALKLANLFLGTETSAAQGEFKKLSLRTIGLSVGRPEGIYEVAQHNGLRLAVGITPGAVFNLVDLLVVQPLDEHVVTEINNLPPTYFMHGSIGEKGEKALEELRVKPKGLAMMQHLYGAGVRFVKLPDSIWNIVSQAEDLNKRGMAISAGDFVYMNQGRLERQYDGRIKDLDLTYFPELQDVGPSGAFSIHLAVPISVSPAKIATIATYILTEFSKSE